MFRFQHLFSRESERKNGIVGVAVPIDELIDDVVVDLEGQYPAHDFYGKFFARGKMAADLGDFPEIAQGIGLILVHNSIVRVIPSAGMAG